jgi:sugar lactone lactonase YvrE
VPLAAAGAPRTEPIATGLAFPECPRWHDGRLWFSDQHTGAVHRRDPDGSLVTVTTVPGGASGLGWLPDGTLLVVSMADCRVLRLVNGELELHADLSPFHQWFSNDMLVDPSGRAYVGSIGFDFYNGAKRATTSLVRIEPDGTAAVAADELYCPNGMVLGADGSTLVVAESLAGRLTAFDVGADGTLTNRRTFADLGTLIPDGICSAGKDGIWFASIGRHEVTRVADGGTPEASVSTADREAVACVVGGPEGRTMYVCTSVSMHPDETVRNRDGQIEAVELPAGW